MSQEEDLKLLDAVRNWRPPKKLHPMAMVAWKMYEEGGNTLSDESISKLREVLDAYGDDLKGLAEACEGLTRFVMYTSQNLGDEENADKVIKLLREYSHRYEPFWQRVGEALSNVGAKAVDNFRSFVGQNQPGEKSAPTLGEKAPEGSVPLKDIMPAARPPPWAPKKPKTPDE
jgi:hypothetical protein